ncbi:ABC transporter ATP-binding protein [Paenibacillus lycopersici]|uniref:Carnitine transport ATP-binding protein OpuCA n=1 Tax=Paenibacillus lycopersici TaxID=2704462 RepID=A0A6C0FWL7_9BACL|nr:ABC transporter ATP-binding protein [Paenibacillus lycopersici]QHT61508.1 ABC transporter ATP-binding protein [Paenibacillus lycopersici]
MPVNETMHEPMNEPMIEITNVSKRFGDFEAIKNVSLGVPEGSFTTLLGPSGCGKTTLMKLIAGFFEPDAGQIRIGGKRMNGLPAFKRDTPLVFQDYALFPHMTVEDNIAYGLKLRKLPRRDVQQKIAAMADMFGLHGLQHRYPRALSGGQQQRVAFARALVTGSRVILMDEPLSNLDAKMRVEVRDELRLLQQRLGFTAIFVTHDQDEALSISDQVAVFDQGRIVQTGTPREIYHRPASAFTAGFVGAANFADGVVQAVEGGELIIASGIGLMRAVRDSARFAEGDRVTMVIRPENIAIRDASFHGDNAWSGFVRRVSFHGRSIRYWVADDHAEWIVDCPGTGPENGVGLEARIQLSVDKRAIHVLPYEGDAAGFGQSIRPNREE